MTPLTYILSVCVLSLCGPPATSSESTNTEPLSAVDIIENSAAQPQAEQILGDNPELSDYVRRVA